MNDKINLNYLESYAHSFTEKVCSEYFGTKKYMSGQEIIQLSPSTQVNLMVIKTLFEKWNEELEMLKANPYFDYKDMAVTEALKEFMNVLSRAIKIEKQHFIPLLEVALIDTVLLAIDPLVYFWGEIEKNPSPFHHLKASKKYIKWHEKLFSELISKGDHADEEAYKKTLSEIYHQHENQLSSPHILLQDLNKVLPLDWDQLIPKEEILTETAPIMQEPAQENPVFFEEEETPELPQETAAPAEPVDYRTSDQGEIDAPKPSLGNGKSIDPALAWARFEAEQGGLLKGPIESLEEGIAINQRFMFTKKLFDGNPDLMNHAFKSIDECDSFVEAVELINERYTSRLEWELDSEEVNEFLHLVYRKFDEK
ncbi:hypothetical protein GCM10007049_12970 [Echinicola pacifica]|uniref:Uncharacterized protein n=1 Tax=Echinicola pacifica TaxID=346377 RepID=A0A918PSX4_9BACT|nr:hypothetical protein [Echinicola pacifica]GGZ21639.1 hypothetical protein GCM10007049_12970 [Echinicola pacifica]